MGNLSHCIKIQRIRMLILAKGLRELSNYPAYFWGERTRDLERASDLLQGTNQDGKSLLVMPSPSLFQGNFSLKQSSSSVVGRSFSVHSCILSVKREAG